MIFNILAGFLCGILSGFGIGGGSLLMLWLTLAAGLPQKTAQGINLLYFLPTALAALCIHHKQGRVRWRVVLPAAIGGCIAAGCAAWLAMYLDTALLRKLFGAFLLFVGVLEMRRALPSRQGRLRR